MELLTLRSCAEALAARRISAVELAETFLSRSQSSQTVLNAFITLLADPVRKQAQLADQNRAKGDPRPLLGVPVALKDLFCTQGVLTTCASKMLANFVAPYDSTVAARLKAAGTLLLGKTNMDEFAMGSSNEASHYGEANNPWDLARVPGGSSGGSAIAVAAGLVPAAMGSDTGGSVRQPAAFCGITGLKPTYGRISRYGMIAYASSLDQAGPMARTAEDCALLLQAVAGNDPQDATSLTAPMATDLAYLNQPLQGLRVGIPREFYDGLDHHNAKLLAEVRLLLEREGASVVEVSLPMLKHAIPIYYIIAPAECSANLSRFDGVRFGYRCADPQNLKDLYRRSRSEAFGAEVQRRILIGTYVLSVGYHDAYYVQAQRLRRLLRDEFIDVFRSVDVLLTPTTPDVAFKKRAFVDPVAMYQQDVFTTPANLAGLPAISFPMGFKDHLPLGAQLIGPHYREDRLLNIVHRYQQHTDFHLKQPPMGR